MDRRGSCRDRSPTREAAKMNQWGWDMVWIRLAEELRGVAAEAGQVNPEVFLTCEPFQTPNFLFRAYAAFSRTPAHEEDVVFSFDCWRDNDTVRLSADIARGGQQILADMETAVVTEWNGPAGNRQLQTAADEVIAFLDNHRGRIVSELSSG